MAHLTGGVGWQEEETDGTEGTDGHMEALT